MAFISTFFLQVSKRFVVQVTNNLISKKHISTVQCSNILCNNFYLFSNNKNVLPGSLPAPLFFNSLRFYAKGKDKKREKGKKSVEINANALSEVINLELLKSQLEKSVELLKDDYIKNLSLRSTTGAIESMPINLDGKEYTLQELAQIVRKNPNTVILNLSTFPQAIPNVLKALTKSGMNLNPQQDGTTLYIPIPKVTKEHRENLSKNAKTLFIKCKEHIRETQMKFTKTVKKQDTLAADLVHSVQEQITHLADQYITEAEKIMKSKQKELVGHDS